MKDYTSLQQVQEDLNSGTCTCVDLVNNYLAKIKSSDINAFLESFDTSALEQAKKVDEKLAANKAGKLAGMVIGIKDNICYRNHKVSASSKILENFESIYSSTAVERLLSEDAIIIGRLNCDEFAMGSSNENSAYGNVKNPVNTEYVPGGSSGGSAAAVKAGLCLATLGSDTGGSIRQPASFCGTVGFKPTYGRISRYGLIAYASSFDQIGPLTHTVEDAALLYEVMAGSDEYDSTCSSKEVEKVRLASPDKKRIAVIKQCLESDGIDPEVKSKVDATIASLESQGHEINYVDFPYLDILVPTYYVITTAEASSNLARFDGVHYGYRSENAVDVESTYVASRSEGFGPEVKRRIMLGTYVLSSGYYDAYFTKAQKTRRLIQDKTAEILAQNDFILTPTTPTTAFKFGANSENPIAMYLQDIFTVQSNLAGGPSISLPLGKHSNGLPFGIQLMGDMFEEAELLAFAHYLMNN